MTVIDLLNDQFLCSPNSHYEVGAGAQTPATRASRKKLTRM
jgi:hypothetical protein